MGNGLAYERIHIFNEVFLDERLWIDMDPQVFQHLFFAPCLAKRFRFKYGIFRAIGPFFNLNIHETGGLYCVPNIFSFFTRYTLIAIPAFR